MSYYSNTQDFEASNYRRTSDRASHAIHFSDNSDDEMSVDSTSSFSDTDSDFSSSNFEDDNDVYVEHKRSTKKAKSKKKKNEERITTTRNPKKRNKVINDNMDYDDDYDDSAKSKTNDDVVWNSSSNEDDEESDSNQTDEDEEEDFVQKEEFKGLVVEKILGTEIRPENQMDPKYYVKFKGKAFGECQWLTRNELKNEDLFHNGARSLKVYDQNIRKGFQLVQLPKVENLKILQSENVEVAKIIAYDENKNKYLVLWQKSMDSDDISNKTIEVLNYEEATWEDSDYIDNDLAIQEYNIRESKLEQIMKQPIPNREYLQRPENYKEYVIRPDNISDYEFSVSLKENQIPVPEFKNGRELRSYQVEGLNWLRKCWYEHKSSILADEMGLGKTAQSVVMVNDLFKLGFRGPFLVVAPLSTLMQWEREFENWTDLNVVLFSGGPQQREIITEYELYYRDNKDVCKFEVMLLNYEKFIKEDVFELINSFTWEYLVVDEAHKLKNHKKKIYGLLESLKVRHKLLLTGTPNQNRLSEFWSLLHFIEPQIFNNLDEFIEKYDSSPDDSEEFKVSQMEKLKNEVINKYMLRREKKEVEHSIGEKEERIVEIELTKTQKKLYEYLIVVDIALSQKNNAYTFNFQSGTNFVMQLRKICNHPALFDEKGGWTNFIDPSEDNKDNLYQRLINTSGKLIFLEKLLEKLKKEKAKILIFSQMTNLLDILEEFCTYKKYKYERIDGSVTGNQRQRAIDSFNSNPDVFIFLLCTRAGGTGLNLTAGNTVIIYDSDWNPQNDAQAQARCHRIGQKNKVEVYRLVSRGTYEDEMLKKILQKIDSQENMVTSKSIQQESSHTLKDGIIFLNKEKEENNHQLELFKNETIDEILEKRTHKLDASDYKETDNNVDTKILLKEFFDNYCSLHQDLIGFSEDQKRSRIKKQVYSDYDESDDDDKDIKDFDFYSILKALKLYGWGRWNEISKVTNFNYQEENLIDICCIILNEISRYLDENILYTIAGEDNLTDSQIKFKKTVLKNKELINFIKNNTKVIRNSLINLNVFNNWYNKNANNISSYISRLEKQENWSLEDDKKLIEGIRIYGWNQWEKIIKGNFNDIQIPEPKRFLKNRFIKLFKLISGKTTNKSTSIKREKRHKKKLNKRIIEEEENNEEPVFSQRVISIAKAIKYFGVPNSEESWSIFSEFSKEENPQEDVQKIIQFSEALLSSQEYNPELVFSDNKEFVFLTYEYANKLISTKKWFENFNKFYKEKFNENMIKSLKSQTTWWNHVEMDPVLFSHISKYGFSRPNTLLSNKELKHLCSDEDITQIKSNIQEETTNHKIIKIQSNPKNKIFYHREQLMEQIDSIISEILKTPPSSTPTISLKSKYFESFNLPFTVKGKDTVIESLGKGKFFSQEGYLNQVGFRSRVVYESKTYYCRITDNSLYPYEIQSHGIQTKYRGKTPIEAIEKAIGKPLPQSINPYEFIGIGYAPIRFNLQKMLNFNNILDYQYINFKEIKKEPKNDDNDLDLSIPIFRGRKRKPMMPPL